MSTYMSLNQYARLYTTLHCSLGMDNDTNPLGIDLMTTILTQYHISKGIKKFGKDGVDAVLAELKKLHDRMVIDPRDPT